MKPARTCVFVTAVLALSDQVLALSEPQKPSKPSSATPARRALLVGLPVATVLAPAAARAEDALTQAGKWVGVLKPFYKWEAPWQAGEYDKDTVRARIKREITSSPVVV